MSKFELSDKELKRLLQEEGLEEPSLRFNKSVLNKVAAYEQAKRLKTPLWLKLVLGIFALLPAAYLVFGGLNLDFGEQTQKNIQWPSVSINLDFLTNSTYFFFTFLVVGAIWMAIIFNRFLEQYNHKHR
ncbi:hypothetical protein [Roseivirga pacifica]|uniref:hypothetical protein n=1 Tax=Roseivirga pacifica TaxID=1267423 RepID=UPI002095D227|nr:hypothetical protein [Roseivirga pacifica]MCO6359621.1 hypothetical protein [Roseivirga pacifica]MCO6366991.1 hypothetical protein [Roseivirga pacifica]MCO6370477.1 hypothetical protein [Roseivirga pacifica]MCO6374648.1 hypothetical protein [Roseivirga pacifica]MCO6379906.1 hypothetical protein [Roseivirga pacifica]